MPTDQLPWSISRALADPVLQFAGLVLVMLAARVLARGRPFLRLGANIVFFLAFTIFLLARNVAPWSQDTSTEDFAQKLFIGLAKATWWIAGAMVLVSFLRMFLIFERKPKEARLLQDLLAGVIYLGAALSVSGYVLGLPVGTLIATSGVFAIVLGLALQSTLNDVFSGIALNLNRPYLVGDWIALQDGVQGQVIETNWRSTHLLSGTNDLIIVPNSALAKARIVNLTGFDQMHGVTITVRALSDKRPAAVEEAMRTVLLSANTILKTPVPTVAVTGLDASAIQLDLSFSVASIADTIRAKSEIYDLIFRHTRAAGIALAPPVGAIALAEGTREPDDQPSTALRLLSYINLFATLTEDEREVLAASMRRVSFRKDEVIVAQGATMDCLMILRSGVVSVEREIDGEMIDLARLAPGDLFGERGLLMAMPETVTMRALTFVVVYAIAKETLAAVMQDRPALAEELGQLLARRMEGEKRYLHARHSTEDSHPTSIAERIKHLFDVPHAGRR